MICLDRTTESEFLSPQESPPLNVSRDFTSTEKAHEPLVDMDGRIPSLGRCN
jgi:hypothetical protein